MRQITNASRTENSGALDSIRELIEKYQRLSDAEKRSYNEQQTIDYFIRPLFETLGWNFTNPAEVVPQQSISGQRADYGFSLNGIPKFYLEAKAFRVDLSLEQHARQAINYAWNKGVTYAVLTNFEGIKVFNAQAQSKDLLSKLIFEISCSDYVTDIERLRLLSKGQFLENALDQYSEKHAKKTKRQTVNKKLFDDLKIAREILTKSFGTWNEKLKSGRETLEEGVQKILDRLVFIRVLEDRGLEPPTLRPLLREWEYLGQTDIEADVIVDYSELVEKNSIVIDKLLDAIGDKFGIWDYSDKIKGQAFTRGWYQDFI